MVDKMKPTRGMRTHKNKKAKPLKQTPKRTMKKSSKPMKGY